MIENGLIAINGIPGSGKTLSATNLARKHYRKANKKSKKYIAYLKKIIYEFLKNNFIFIKIKNLYNKMLDYIHSKKILNILLLLFKLLIKLFLILLLFVTHNYTTKFLIIFYLSIYKRLKNNFDSLDYNYYKLFPYEKINNVYSSYPILLDKKLNVWSNKIDIYDLTNNYSFLPHSLIIIDELQLFIDSDEYMDDEKKKIISKIAKFLQSHRHFGIDRIIFTSQSPTRIFKKARNIVIGYLKQRKIIKIPLTPFALMIGTMYYDFEYYGRYIPRDREERKKLPFDYKRVITIFNIDKAYESYDSKYLSLYNYNKPLLNKGQWKDFKVPIDILNKMFDDEIVQEHKGLTRACTFKKKDSVT